MIDAILALPAALKLGLTLLGIVALMRARVPMGVALLAGAALLAVLFPMTPPAFARALLGGLISDQTVFLLTIIVAILVFSGALDATGQIARIIDAFKAMVGESRLTLIPFHILIAQGAGGTHLNTGATELTLRLYKRASDWSLLNPAVTGYKTKSIYPAQLLAGSDTAPAVDTQVVILVKKGLLPDYGEASGHIMGSISWNPYVFGHLL